MQNLRPEQKSLKYTNMCQQRKIFSNMKYFALSKNRANIQMHRQQLQLPCQSRKCSYSWFCMADWVGIFLQVELIYREYATGSLHWFVNSYIWNCIYYRYYIIQISYHKYYILQISQINYYSCYIQGVPKKVTFKMLLEPGCTRSITSSGHPFQPDLDEPMSGNDFFLVISY